MTTTDNPFEGIDPAELAGDLKATESMTNPSAAAGVRDHIKTAALVGIFAELTGFGIMLAEMRDAAAHPAEVPGDWEPVTDAAGNVAGYLHPELAEKVATALGAERTPETVGGAEPLHFELGDAVTILDGDRVGKVAKIGASEGEPVLTIVYDGDESAVKAWARDVRHVDDEPEGDIEVDGKTDGDEVDELDDDFTPPAEAPDAFATIKKGKAKK